MLHTKLPNDPFLQNIPNDQMTHYCKIYQSQNFTTHPITVNHFRITSKFGIIFHTHRLRYLNTDVLAYLHNDITIQYNTVK